MTKKGSLCAEERKELSKKLSSVHSLYFIGIGGSGMYACACLAQDLGFSVQGSDAAERENVFRLKSRGIPVAVGVEPLPKETGAVVYTLAVGEEHPQMQEARKKDIPRISRNDFLGIITERFPIRVAIAGSHGKSSTVGMCAAILSRAGFSPTVLAGADLTAEEGGYRRGSGNIVLIEACEYRDAFFSLSPTHAAVLNAEWEHTDYFRNEESIRTSFLRFLNGESVIYRIAGESTGLAADMHFASDDGVHAEDITRKEGFWTFDIYIGKKRMGAISLQVLGRHQVDNALAAFSIAYALGVPKEIAVSALGDFRGVGARMELIGKLRGAPLYLDYAHHPTELAAAIKSAKDVATRLVCVFEPHTFSRVHAFYEQFKALLSLPDKTGILPIYPAREINVFGVSSEKLASESGAAFLPDFSSAADFLRENADENTVLLLAGAGCIRDVLRFTE